ncbi:hypothetical protein GDO81_021999 [Engystomops pustulosus]|nr:hypothetical protein GDO81_021999 [Engystomops pustulosus]
MAPGRHIWHRQESDDSGDSVSGEGPAHTTSSIPTSASCPSPSAVQREDKMAPISAHRFSASTDFGSVQRPSSNLARQPMGGWSEDPQSTRHPETVPEEGSEDELPPQTHKV